MKCFLVPVTAAALLLGSGNAMAQEEDYSNQLLGAIAGYYLGNSVGDGDGRKAARVIGAVIGWRYGNEILGEEDQEYHHYFRSYGSREFTDYCRANVPTRYDMERGTRRSWIQGCVQALEERKRQLEFEAYQAGRNLED